MTNPLQIQTLRARKVRRRIADYLNFLIRHAAAMPYQEYRAMRSYPTEYMKVPAHATDCSESSAIVLEASGAPTAFKVGDLCYTGTFLSQLLHVPKWRSRRGDAVVICTAAEPNGAHMVLLLQGGMFHRDPLCFSHGRDGVDVMPISQMVAGFPATRVVYCRTVPTRY